MGLDLLVAVIFHSGESQPAKDPTAEESRVGAGEGRVGESPGDTVDSWIQLWPWRDGQGKLLPLTPWCQ